MFSGYSRRPLENVNSTTLSEDNIKSDMNLKSSRFDAFDLNKT